MNLLILYPVIVYSVTLVICRPQLILPNIKMKLSHLLLVSVIQTKIFLKNYMLLILVCCCRILIPGAYPPQRCYPSAAQRYFESTFFFYYILWGPETKTATAIWGPPAITLVSLVPIYSLDYISIFFAPYIRLKS